MKHKILTLITTLTLTLTPTAQAIPYPDMTNANQYPIPAGTQPQPTIPMTKAGECKRMGIVPNTNPETTPPAQLAWNMNKLHEFATGKGIKVAVIDSGINPNIRLPQLTGGGDYVTGGDGLEDCDSHGTLVAGIIGAQEAQNDEFVGVAPDVEIISIRQTSAAYVPEKPEDQGKQTSSLATLANAIVRAVNLGANVINMSVTSCYPADVNVDTRDLQAAINYANSRGVVLVTAAGNADPDSCKPNPGPSAEIPTDTRGWETVETLSMPSYYTPGLISVGGVTPRGAVFEQTMTGPWIDVAAPASDIVSLDPAGGDRGTIINGEVVDSDIVPVSGTSFASAYVAGLVALMLEVDPELTPGQVSDRLMNAARPSNTVSRGATGAGAVDPVAALTSVSSAVGTGVSSLPVDDLDDDVRGVGFWAGVVFVLVLLTCVVVLGYIGLFELNRRTRKDVGVDMI